MLLVLPLAVGLEVALAAALALAVHDALPVGVPLSVPLPDTLAVAETVGASDNEALCLALPVALVDGVADSVTGDHGAAKSSHLAGVDGASSAYAAKSTHAPITAADAAAEACR